MFSLSSPSNLPPCANQIYLTLKIKLDALTSKAELVTRCRVSEILTRRIFSDINLHNFNNLIVSTIIKMINAKHIFLVIAAVGVFFIISGFVGIDYIDRESRSQLSKVVKSIKISQSFGKETLIDETSRY